MACSSLCKDCGWSPNIHGDSVVACGHLPWAMQPAEILERRWTKVIGSVIQKTAHETHSLAWHWAGGQCASLNLQDDYTTFILHAKKKWQKALHLLNQAHLIAHVQPSSWHVEHHYINAQLSCVINQCNLLSEYATARPFGSRHVMPHFGQSSWPLTRLSTFVARQSSGEWLFLSSQTSTFSQFA